MTPEGDAKHKENFRLFASGLYQWLSKKDHVVPDIKLNLLKKQWNLAGEEDEEKILALLKERGWKLVNHTLVPLTPEEKFAGSQIHIKPGEVTQVVVDGRIPRPQPPGPEKDGDGRPYNLDEDA